MQEIEVILLLMLLRVILPLGLILGIGEYFRRREIHDLFLPTTR
ncbi:MAG TPA: hypothetical protein VF918_19320 [Anaerolineales bacterium]